MKLCGVIIHFFRENANFPRNLQLKRFFPQAIIEKRNTEGHIFFEDILFTYVQCNIFKLDTQHFYIVIYKI